MSDSSRTQSACQWCGLSPASAGVLCQDCKVLLEDLPQTAALHRLLVPPKAPLAAARFRGAASESPVSMSEQLMDAARILQIRLVQEEEQPENSSSAEGTFRGGVEGATAAGELTVMLTNLTGAEPGQRLADVLEAKIAKRIGNNEGILIRNLGMAALACFDDAAQATQAAVQMQSDVTEQLQEEEVSAISTNLKIGIHTGTARLWREKSGGYRPFLGSELVNTVSRIEAFATGAEILISQPVQEALEEPLRSACESIGKRPVFGIIGFVKLARLRWEELPGHKPRSAREAWENRSVE